MSDLSQKMQNFARGKPDFLKTYIFNEVRKAAIWRQSSKGYYQHEKKKTMLETFNEMCRLYGDGVMEYPEFEYWYIKFYSGDFDMDHSWSSSENRRPSALQRFIFSDVVMDVPIWTSFKKYCDTKGNEMTDYTEYEYWYMRMYNGNFEMDHDRSADPKQRSFTDLPIHIFEKITKKFNFAEKLIIRKVSKPLQSLVDSWKPNIKKIKISNDYKGMCWSFDDMIDSNVCVDYSDSSDCSYDEDTSDDERQIVSKKYEERFDWKPTHRYRLHELKAVLGNPKLRLSSLKIANCQNNKTKDLEELITFMKSKRIHVEDFWMLYNSGSNYLLPIIEQFNPEVLKEVHLNIGFNTQELANSNELISQLAESEHLKNVKMLKIRGDIGPNAHPFHCFLGCRRVTIENYDHMNTAKRAAIVIKTLVKSTVLEVFYIKSGYDFNVNAIMKQFGSRSFAKVPNRPNVRRHKVPNSDKFYETEVTEKMIRIERIP